MFAPELIDAANRPAWSLDRLTVAVARPIAVEGHAIERRNRQARGTVLDLLQPLDAFSSRGDVVYQAAPARAQDPPLREQGRGSLSFALPLAFSSF